MRVHGERSSVESTLVAIHRFRAGWTANPGTNANSLAWYDGELCEAAHKERPRHIVDEEGPLETERNRVRAGYGSGLSATTGHYQTTQAEQHDRGRRRDGTENDFADTDQIRVLTHQSESDISAADVCQIKNL